ncbi:MAG: LamG-like jellyroll fold domain-containing protein [Ignavibacteria bacterium]|nr:LamG-like jellyroll fold domain-containing protein [Ignavibacteria bacterium]
MKKWFQVSLAVCAFLFSINTFGGVKVIAHRGGSYLAPENTAAAFRKAAELKADYFELDIQTSIDDSLMIMHDATIDRTTNSSGTLSSKSYQLLRILDAGSKFSAAFAGEKIPTFSEALSIAKNDPNNIGIVAEIKAVNSTIVGKVVKMIQDYGMQSRVIISSFSLTQITEAKTLDPTIRVQLFATITNSLIDQVAAIGGEWVGSGGTTTQALIDYAHSKNVLYNAWTINSAAQMLPLIKTTVVDGITTDAPDVLIALADTSGPTDVVVNSAIANGTVITLTWQPAEDTQSGVSGYLVYRDVSPSPVTLYATLGNVTEFVDQTFTEAQAYYYRVKAKNPAGITSVNYSNEVTATTGSDVTKPLVAFVSSSGDTSTVVVEFNERVDQVTAETKTNYTINKSVVVLGAKLALDQKQVILSTTQMADTTYTITVKNVKDKAITPNAMVTSSTIFMHKNMSPNIVASYKLDETVVVGADTLIYDASANANNGVVLNGPVVAEGLLGNALQFDGVDDFVQFQTTPSFDLPSGLVSISLWTKLAYLPAELPAAYGALFDSETDNYVLYEDRGNNQLRFKVSTTGGAARPGIAAADLKTGEWIHVVGVYDGANASIYLNGVFKNSLPVTGTVKTGQVATLGKSGTAAPTFFKGSMDNVQVFNRALTAQEVADMYAKTKTMGVSPNPSDVILNAPVANETDVALSWTPAITYESTLMGYEIYRDATPDATTLVATVAGNKTEYTDATNKENQTFYYRVRAKNSVALKSLNYSNEVSAATTTDAKSPYVAYLTAQEKDTKVVVEFSELVDQTTAENAANYQFDLTTTATSAKLALDGKTVILKTTPLSEAVHMLTVNNVKDKAASANTIVTNSSYEFSVANLSSDIIAYYSMDGTRVDTLVDATVNGNNGIFMSTTAVAPGFSGNSLSFNGVDDYVQFSQSPSFDIPGGLVSVSIWTKLEYLPTEMLLGTGPLFDSHGDEYVMYEDKGNKELRFKAVNSTNGAARPGIPQADLITGQWINAVGVFDGTNAMIYLNGVKKGSLPLTGTVKTGQVAMLGRSAVSGTTSFFKGCIDNVAVYNKALSQAEVEAQYANHKIVAKSVPVPVELTAFSAEAIQNKVSVRWETATEKNNLGFEIQRSSDKQNFAKIGFVTGAGTTVEKHSYVFTDNTPAAGKNYYRLKQIDVDGSVNYSQIVESGKIIPREFDLSQNYPNPFNPETKLSYQLPITGKVSLKVFDIIGREVATLVDEVKEAGTYDVSFNGKGFASGAYFYRFQSGNFVKIKKMILLK